MASRPKTPKSSGFVADPKLTRPRRLMHVVIKSTKSCTPASPRMPPPKVVPFMKAAISTAEWRETPAARAVEHLSLGWYGRATSDKEP